MPVRSPLSRALTPAVRGPFGRSLTRTTLASILSKHSGSHLWDFGVSADKVAYGAAYPNVYLNAELNSNPGPFTATTGYTAGTFTGGALPTLSIVSSLLRVTTAESNYGVAEMSFPTVIGKKYQVILGVSTISTGDRLIYRIGSTVQGYDYANASLASGATPSDYKGIFTATGTTCYVTFGNHATPPGSFTEFNKVTCKEVYASAAAEFAAAYPTHNLYQDSAGTTPAFLPTHPVGLCLDQPSGSVVLGAELVTNSDNEALLFSNPSPSRGAMTRSTEQAQTGSASAKFVCTSEVGAHYFAVPSMTVGKVYRVEMWVYLPSGQTTTQLDMVQAGSVAVGGTNTTTATNQWVKLSAQFMAAYTSVGIVNNKTNCPNEYFYIDNISVKEVLGSHASQSTSTKRPVLSARVNLLVATEDFSVGNWTNLIGGTGSTPVKTPGFTDPNGGSTAWRIQCNRGAGNTSADYSVVRQAVSISGPSIYTSSIWVKSNTGATQTFNLDVANGQPVTATTSWTRVFSQQAAPGRFDISNYGPDGGTAALDILVWHPDIRPAQTPASFPAYQRVTSASDYDTAGFPLRAVWDGVDDCLVVPTLDLSITDKVTVVAGVQKVGTTSWAALLEFTGNPDVTAGAFSFNAPGGAADTFYASARGATANATKTVTGYASPVSAVLTNKADLSAATSTATNTFSVNGATVSAAGGGSAPGGGNFASAGLYIGQRNGSIYPFSGAIQSITIIPALITASETAVIEASVNNSMGKVY